MKETLKMSSEYYLQLKPFLYYYTSNRIGYSEQNSCVNYNNVPHLVKRPIMTPKDEFNQYSKLTLYTDTTNLISSVLHLPVYKF